MADLTPAVITLDKGLDLQKAKIVAPPGSVLSDINYEQVDFQGLKRIDGYARYDGSVLPALDEYYQVGVSGGTPLLNDLVWTVNPNTQAAELLFGVVVGTDNAIDSSPNIDSYIAIINQNVTPKVGDSLQYWTFSDNEYTVNTYSVVSANLGTDSGILSTSHYTNLVDFIIQLRSRVGKLPGATIGLHWFRDRLYAVADVAMIGVTGITDPFYPGDIITLAGGQSAKVLDVCELDLTSTSPNFTTLFLDTTDTTDWYQSSSTIYRNSIANGTTCAHDYTGAVSQEGAIDQSYQIASLFQARSESQVITEDAPGPYYFGWRFVDQGWVVNFTAGNTLYGSLPSLNQNISGLGIQGPTDTGGEDGSALLMTQQISIAGAAVSQVSGWKNSDSSSSYQLTAANVSDDDSLYIYADAYVSWNGQTGVVSAPGYTDSNLIQYSPTNTVDIS